jgi:hypothetical protein
MDNPFFEKPILNSPYERPQQHWELDPHGQPTQKIIQQRRRAEFITPIPKPRKRKAAATQEQIVFDEGKGLSTKEQQYDPTSIINQLRQQVDQWRRLPNPNTWQVTPETARLLEHWRHHKFAGIRPFFCQVEAVEAAIWLTEVAPHSGKAGQSILDHLANANNDANPELMRLALKLATGAGKTTVMAMLIAWQTINAVRRPQSQKFTRGFLIVAPGLTIKDRLRVLQPNDPDSYYGSRELVPTDLLEDVNRAKIVITNYHAFKLRERIELSKGGRSLLQGRGEELNTLETEGQMLQRVIDLSATPFFLSGSGYVEGTLFPWTMSDFSLMDAIECGIVKLPRVPVADNIPGEEMPMFRNLWEHISKKMPKKGRGQGETLDPLSLPPQPPRETTRVKAIRPERDALEIRFPRVVGYRVELPEEQLKAEFNEDSVMELTPDLVGATET